MVAPSLRRCIVIVACFAAVPGGVAWADAAAVTAPGAPGAEERALEQILAEQAARRAQRTGAVLQPPKQPVPQAATAQAAVPRGPQPLWVAGPDPAYPRATYLCAVGVGPQRDAAANAAYGSLAKTFVAQVSAVSEDFAATRQSAGSAGVTEETTQSAQASNRVSSDTVLQGVAIYETWQDAAQQVYALACLERARVGSLLRDQMAAADARAAALLKQAEGGDKNTRLQALSAALDATATRSVLATQLRWVDVGGQVNPPVVDAAEVAARLAEALQSLRVGVYSAGPQTSECHAALLRSLTDRGYRIASVTDGTAMGEFDVVVLATMVMENVGTTMVGPTAMQLARGTLQVEIKNAQGAVLAAYAATQKAGSQTMADAQRRVARGLAGQVTQGIGTQIDATLRGAPK